MIISFHLGPAGFIRFLVISGNPCDDNWVNWDSERGHPSAFSLLAYIVGWQSFSSQVSKVTPRVTRVGL